MLETLEIFQDINENGHCTKKIGREQQQQQIALQNSRRTNWLHVIIRCIEFFFLILECIILKLSQVKYIFFVECDNSNIFTVLQIP